MRTERFEKLNMVENFLFLVCSSTAVLYAAFFLVSTGRIIRHFKAREFLGRIDRIPRNPKVTLILILVLIALLAGDFTVHRLFSDIKKNLSLLMTAADLFICLGVVILLDFNFNGILLWFFAVVIAKVEGKKGYYPIIILAIAVYTLTYPSVATVGFRTYTLADFLSTYTSSQRSYLSGFFNLLNILCVVGFFMVCALMIVSKQRRLEESNALADQLSQANARLKETNQQLEELMEENAHMAEIRERNRIAREVHDTIGHTLTGLAFGVDACKALADGSSRELKEQLEILSTVAREGIKDVRQSVSSLKVDDVEGRNVISRIQRMLENTRSATHTEIHFDCRIPSMVLDEEEEHAIYRIVQESVTNAVQHGRAHYISIQFTKEEDQIGIYIRDNGKGCPHPEEGFGLRHMRQRVAMLHGSIRFDGSDGFEVAAKIPVRWREKQDESTNCR